MSLADEEYTTFSNHTQSSLESFRLYSVSTKLADLCQATAEAYELLIYSGNQILDSRYSTSVFRSLNRYATRLCVHRDIGI
jgi:hypothetical protein